MEWQNENLYQVLKINTGNMLILNMLHLLGLWYDQKKEKQENNQALEAIISSLSDAEYVDVHGLETAHEVWKKLEDIYRGNEHVKISKEESLRGKFDDMQMAKGENIQ